MQTIPTNYVPTLIAANAYLARNPDVVAAYNAASPNGWNRTTVAWDHYQRFGNGEGRLWDFPATGPVPPVIIAPITSNSEVAGILDGEIFGISKKLLAIGAIAYFVFAGKD